MDKVTFFEGIDGVEMAIIDNADGSFTSMTKEEYDRRQVEHLTEIITPDEA